MDRASGSREKYHHGNLVEALIAATVAIIEENGVEQVSVREAAKRVGVSPGAPFRHFPTKVALLTAVAEQAMSRLTSAVASALEEQGDSDPMAAFEAIGRGYLQWAMTNPTHFQVISSRTLIDFHGSEKLCRQNADIRVVMVDLLERAASQGQIAPGQDIDDLVLTARAFAYGLARMWIDGHFPEWVPPGPPDEAIFRSLKLFIAGFAQTRRDITD